MKVPALKDFEFTPLIWKECMVKGSYLKTKQEIYDYFKEENASGKFDWCEKITATVSNDRVKKLLIGYALFDIMYWSSSIELSRFKMWQLFEDLVAEIFREMLRNKDQCTVVSVDKLPGFKGLDYVVANSSKREGWTVGVQCKRYIGSVIPHCRLKDYGSWSRGTSAAYLIEKAFELRRNFGSRRKFVLIAFNALRRNKRQERRFKKLQEKSAWDSVVVLDKSIDTTVPYVYELDLRELNRVIKWC